MMDDEEYRCDCQKRWRKRVLSGCIAVTAVVLAMWLVLVVAFDLSHGASFSNVARALLFISIATVANITAVFAAHKIGKSPAVSDKVKDYACVFALVLILAMGAQLHKYVYVSLLFPCLAVAVVPPFADKKLLDITFFATICTSIFSCLLWAYLTPESLLAKIAVVVGVLGSCCVFYFFSRAMLKAMMEQMEFVTNGWAEQERLISELRLEPLTRLYNRTAFQEAISAAMSDFRHFGHAATLAFIDLDNFKTVNDTYGHASGDAVLIAFSELLIGTLGTNRNVFRYGGDEFAVLFKDVPMAEVKITMETVRGHYANMSFDFLEDAAPQSSGEAVKVSASIGIAAYREGMTSKEWITAADDAAYDAKKAGKNTVVINGV